VPHASPETIGLAVVCACVGLLVGSFLNVVIARVPDGESVVRPGSRCPACRTPIAPRDNVPLVSWLLLRGRARCCGVRIPRRYPLVEVGTAVAFGLLALRTGPSWLLPALLYLAALSIALAVIDVDTYRLPFGLVAPAYPVAAALLGGAALVSRDGTAAWRMVAGAGVLWGLYRLLHAVYPAGMGYGDVRLSGVLGLYLGWAGWPEVFVGLAAGFFVGGLAGLLFIALGRRKLGSSIPYGPYLLTGAWIGLLAGAPVADWYLRSAGL
jgi:leader peptidase (prepilin peptidase)/N-methyltransferase